MNTKPTTPGAWLAVDQVLPLAEQFQHWIDEREALAWVERLMAIPGKSTEEHEVAEEIRQGLLEVGVPRRAIVFDRAHERTRRGGQCGNLICRWPSNQRGPCCLLTAHLDTVPLCEGSQPVRRGRRYRSGIKGRALGADDRAGAAVLLVVARVLARHHLKTGPLRFCWFVQEEIGLEGSRHVELARLGKPWLAFNWDGGAAHKVVIGATGAYRMEVEILGRASHAGNAPQDGVSAIVIASLAIAQLYQDGWHGQIVRPEGSGTSNVGIIVGGQATNVVPDRVVIHAEARSHDPSFRREIVRQFRDAFKNAAQRVRSCDNRMARIRFRQRLDYESYLLNEKHPAVQIAVGVLKHLGLEPELAVARGGLDANWLVRHGIPTVTLGCGQIAPHTEEEQLDIPQFLHACRVALGLALYASQLRNPLAFAGV